MAIGITAWQLAIGERHNGNDERHNGDVDGSIGASDMFVHIGVVEVFKGLVQLGG